jgi:hypothetical protein
VYDVQYMVILECRVGADMWRYTHIKSTINSTVGLPVAQLVEALRYKKVAGSIPNGVTVIFQWHNFFCLTVALGSNQPLTEMSTRKVHGEEDLPLSCAQCLEIWAPELLDASEIVQYVLWIWRQWARSDDSEHAPTSVSMLWRQWARFECVECKIVCLCWLLHHRLSFLFLYVMKACEGAEVRNNSFLNWALGSGEWWASRLGRPASRSIISRRSLNRRLAGCQSPSERFGKEYNNIMTPPKMQSVSCTNQRRWYTLTSFRAAVLKRFWSAAHYFAMRNIAAHP